MKSQLTPIQRRQFLESILKHEVRAEEMQKYEDMIKVNDLARVADILEKGFVNRRDFLKCGGLAALLGGIAAVSNNCAGGSVVLGGVKETGPVHYPRLPGHKIQSPEHYGLEGCMTGWFEGNTFMARMLYRVVGWKKVYESYIETYTKKVGKDPSIFIIGYADSRLPSGFFPFEEAAATAENGIIPFITYDLRSSPPYADWKGSGNEMIYSLKDIINGKADHLIKRFARQAREFGDQYGGFFIRTMREMNIPRHWPPWGGMPYKFKKAWRHIWDIFDGEGANEYATWVWNPSALSVISVSPPEFYYPGDKYIDWIGLNGYSRSGSDYFTRIFGSKIRKLHRLHPTKPMMIAEYGIDEHGYKVRQVKDAFERVKKEYHEIKALLWWDMDWTNLADGGVDSRINSSAEALQAFREAIADPYFLAKVPYRKI